MANEYKAIPDEWVEGYKPVTSRLMKRFARNIDATCRHAIEVFNQSGNTTSASYVTAFSLPIRIPDCYIGSGGVRISIGVLLTVNESGSGNQGTARISEGANNGTAQTVTAAPASGSANDNLVLTLDYTPTGNQVLTFDVEILSTDGTNTVSVGTTNAYTANNFIASLPRAA